MIAQVLHVVDVEVLHVPFRQVKSCLALQRSGIAERQVVSVLIQVEIQSKPGFAH
jgi:hypothetical protein